MKRIAALALAFVLLTAALASCGTREKVDLSKMTSLAEINGSGAIIAAQSGTFHLTALQEQMTGVEKKEYKDFTTLLTALTSGAIDGYIAEEPTAVDACAQNSSLGYIKLKNNDTGFTVTGDDNGIAIGLRKGSELTAQINAILAEKIPSSVQTALMEQVFTICVNPESEQNLTLAHRISHGYCSRPTPTHRTERCVFRWNARTTRSTGRRPMTQTVPFSTARTFTQTGMMCRLQSLLPQSSE